VASLRADSDALDVKLQALRGGAALVSAADVAAAEKSFGAMLAAWARRRRVFLNIWGEVSQNMEGKESDLFEEMGVETDEAVGEALGDYQRLLGPANKRAKP
jgi:26S proteasome regulatory subunit (ATPase 3-interacting protein)